MKFSALRSINVVALVSYSIILVQLVRAEAPLRARLEVSDKVVLRGDPVLYKLLLENTSTSTIYVTSPINDARLVQFLETRRGKDDWNVVGERSAEREGRTDALVKIAGKETYAIRGVFFVSDANRFVFDKEGSLEIRVRINCALGEFVTNTEMIAVKERPDKEQMELVRRNVPRVYKILTATAGVEKLTPPQEELRQKLTSGSLDKSLEMFHDVATYLKDGTVRGETCDHYGAFERISKELDPCRKDQVASLLAISSHKLAKWDQLEKLSNELKEDCAERSNFRAELEAARERALRGMP